LSLRLHTLHHGLGERHRREARRAGKALLARRIDRVDFPLVDLDGRSAERGDGVDDHQRAVLVRNLGKQLGVGLRAGGGLRVHEADDLGVLVLLQRVFELLRVDRVAPLVLDQDRRAAAAHRVFQHAAAEHAVLAHDHLVARGDHVHEAEFHPDRARARQREGERVLRLIDIAQQGLELLHHLDEHRIEIADRRLAHGGQHARVDLGRAGAHQRALRRMEGMDAFRGGVLAHGIALRKNSERGVVGARFHAHRVLGAGFIDDIGRADSALGDALDLAGPARGNIAGLRPMMHDRAVELKGARDLGLAAEHLDQSLCAVHWRKFRASKRV